MRSTIIYSTIILTFLVGQDLLAHNKVQIFYQVGTAYLQRKEYSKAIDQFEQALKINPQNLTALKKMGEIYKEQKKYYKASACFLKALQVAPDNVDIYFDLAQIYTLSRNYADAIKIYQHILKLDSLNMRARVALGDVLSWDKQWVRAMEQYHRVLAIFPENIEALSGLARLAAWNNDFDRAIEYYQQALTFDPSNAHLHKGLAEVLSWKGDHVAAINQYKKVIRMEPNYFEAYRHLGQVYGWSGQYKRAIEVYQQVIQLQPDEKENYVGLAQIYRWNRQFEKAKQMYHAALKLDPQDAVILRKLHSLKTEMPYWQTQYLLYLKNLLFIFVALILIYYIRRYQRVLGQLSLLRIILLRVIPALAFGSIVVIFSSWFLMAPYRREAMLIMEIIEIIGISLLAFSIVVLLWILRFGHQVSREVVLAIGAHPDDLELGCGGTILRYREEGCMVIGLVLSGGENGVCKGDCKHRMKEAKKGAKVLHLNQLFIMNFEDTKFSKHVPEIKQAIEEMIAKFQPDIILTHSSSDLHSDHRAVYEATKEAARGPQSVLMYENTNTPSSFTPDFFVDISGTLIEKIEAVKKHKTQSNKAYIAPSAIKSMAKFRGTQAKVEYAEGFKILKMVKNHSRVTYRFDSYHNLLPAPADVYN